jgi:hypothetical protein
MHSPRKVQTLYDLMLDNKPRELTPHVMGHAQTTSPFYAIISDSSKPLFIDYGSASWNFFSSFLQATRTYDRMRFVDSVDTLRARDGLNSIDVAVPSQMHDDHLNGSPHLASVKLSISPGESGNVPVTIPRAWAGAPVRLAIAVDVKADGKYLGQIAEAVIDVRASGIPAAATTASGF